MPRNRFGASIKAFHNRNLSLEIYCVANTEKNQYNSSQCAAKVNLLDVNVTYKCCLVLANWMVNL